MLTRANQLDAARAAQAAHPGRFYISASTRLTDPSAAADLTQAVKQGAIAFGELKDPVEADGPERLPSARSPTASAPRRGRSSIGSTRLKRQASKRLWRSADLISPLTPPPQRHCQVDAAADTARARESGQRRHLGQHT